MEPIEKGVSTVAQPRASPERDVGVGCAWPGTTVGHRLGDARRRPLALRAAGAVRNRAFSWWTLDFCGNPACLILA